MVWDGLAGGTAVRARLGGGVMRWIEGWPEICCGERASGCGAAGLGSAAGCLETVG